MIGRIVIFIDSEVKTSFKAEVNEWVNRCEFKIPRAALQLEVGETPTPQLEPLKYITLHTAAQLLGDIIGEPYICLFFYNYDNPTMKQIELDVQIAKGMMMNSL